MTPLAHRLAKQLCLPVKDRGVFWQQNAHNLRDALDDTHFFEATEVLPLLPILMDRERGVSEQFFCDRVFLPAPKTWIEFKNPAGHQAGVLLKSPEGSTWARVSYFFDDVAGPLGWLSTVSDDYKTHEGEVAVPTFVKELWGKNFFPGFLALAQWILVIINSPKVIGRKQIMPHRGLEKRLLKTKALSGRFPLHAWTELTLEATPTHVDQSGEVHEARLTGQRCLHFCRKHLRVRNGRLELVSAHWRGDPALGIKRTRYKLVPPKQEAA